MSHATSQFTERHWELLKAVAEATEPVRIDSTTTRQDLFVQGLIRPGKAIATWVATRAGLEALADRNQAREGGAA